MEGFFSLHIIKEKIKMEENESAYRKLCRLMVRKPDVSKRRYLFPNGYDTKGLVTTEPFNIPFDALKQLKLEEIIDIHLDRGLIEIHDKNTSRSRCRYLEGFFEGQKDGNIVSGIMIGDIVDSNANRKHEDEYLLENKEYVKVLEGIQKLKTEN